MVPDVPPVIVSLNEKSPDPEDPGDAIEIVGGSVYHAPALVM